MLLDYEVVPKLCNSINSWIHLKSWD